MHEIDRPHVSPVTESRNPAFWERVVTTLKTGKAIEAASLEEIGYTSLLSLRTAARYHARQRKVRAHVTKTGTGYAVWFTKG